MLGVPWSTVYGHLDKPKTSPASQEDRGRKVLTATLRLGVCGHIRGPLRAPTASFTRCAARTLDWPPRL